MAWGGRRAGAGRKPGAANRITKELRDRIKADKLIDELQAIVFRNKGDPTVSDRICAIKFLLNKVVPDMHREYVEEALPPEPFHDISDEHAEKIARNALKAIELRRKRKQASPSSENHIQ